MGGIYLGCDVDLTICPSGTKWGEWLLSQASPNDLGTWEGLWSGFKIQPYNLASLFPSVENPMQYWKDLDYSQFEPIEGSVEGLEELSKYYGILFISHVEGSHGKSKCEWLKKHYPFLTGISYTREKFIHNDSVVAMIDDRNSHLSGFDANKRIRFETPYSQDFDCNVRFSSSNWKEITNYLLGR